MDQVFRGNYTSHFRMMSVSYHWDMPRWLGDTYIGDSEVLEKI